MRAPSYWQTDGVAARLMAPLGAAYAGFGWLRWRLHQPEAAPVPVLCVGNATVGGTGKTPIVLDLLGRLAGRGVEVHGLCRGYGGSLEGPVRVDPRQHAVDDVGDEALLLAAIAPTWVARDRLAGARAAAAAGAVAIVLDDGLQYSRLQKQMSLLVVDAATGFGNGRVVPAGPLREPAGRALTRADVLVLVGDGTPTDADLASFSGACWRCRLGATPEAEALAGTRAVAFAGIGRPEKLFETAQALGIELVATVAFPDHHRFTAAELKTLSDQACGLGARLLTTTKDLVRLPEPFRAQVDVLPIEVQWADTTAVDGLLDALVQQK